MSSSYSHETFHEILFELIELDFKFDYSIYYIEIKDKNNIANILLESNEIFTIKHQVLITEHKILKLYIKSTDRVPYEKDISNLFYNDIKNESVSINRKSSIIHTFASSIMENIFITGTNEKNIACVKEIVDNSINLITNSNNSTKAMLGLVSYNYTTYTHSVDVSVYAIGFGKYLNLCSSDLKSLGEGAILHDVGKSMIPNEIINKNGSLSEEEFNVMKKHPILGKQILIKENETNQDVLDIVKQHHERYYGGGYPYNLKKDQINPLAQIIAIVDIFNALTTKRSYKQRFTTFSAFNLMKEKMQENLNPELFKKFISFMSQTSN